MLARDCIIVGIELAASWTSGLTQRLTLRDAGSASTGLTEPLVWDSGIWDTLYTWI